MRSGFIHICAVLLFWISSSEILFAQNLVVNGSFDDKRGSRNSPKPWRFVNTVDFFVPASNRHRPMDTEKWNLPKPKDGEAYVGIRIYPDYREFIQIQLSEKLEAGKKYDFEMWVSWSDHSNYYAKELGASIYPKKPSYTSEYYIYTNPPQINSVNQKGILQSDSTVWIPIRGVYRAKGGERYLSIGNFSTDHFKTRLKKKRWYGLKFWHHEAYYFVDAVSLVKQIDPNDTPDTLIAQEPDTIEIDFNENHIYDIEKDSLLVVPDIQFASGSETLLPQSYKELELILEYLNENPRVKIQIIGHTDDIGTESSNQRLSEARAKTVYKYFIQNKVYRDRLSYLGMGEKSPIESNETNLGRKANRRVELKIIE
jgi:outer membrane protein OmpA-like peptidoglycan-associated protein